MYGGLNVDILGISFLRKGEVLAYVGRIHNLKDLTDGVYASAILWINSNTRLRTTL